MADGDQKTGRISKTGQKAHTDGTQQAVATITLPNVEGYYDCEGSVSFGTAAASGKGRAKAGGCVMVNDGAASVGAQGEYHNVGGTGYVAAITTSGLTVSISLTAANGVRSVGRITCEAGVELAITPA